MRFFAMSGGITLNAAIMIPTAIMMSRVSGVISLMKSLMIFGREGTCPMQRLMNSSTPKRAKERMALLMIRASPF